MSPDKLERVKVIVHNAKSNVLRTAKSRKAFCKRLSVDANLWEPEVYSFVEEMVGLNFFIAEDRVLFIQFIDAAF